LVLLLLPAGMRSLLPPLRLMQQGWQAVWACRLRSPLHSQQLLHPPAVLLEPARSSLLPLRSKSSSGRRMTVASVALTQQQQQQQQTHACKLQLASSRQRPHPWARRPRLSCRQQQPMCRQAR
jgi:hypothetical protein